MAQQKLLIFSVVALQLFTFTEGTHNCHIKTICLTNNCFCEYLFVSIYSVL